MSILAYNHSGLIFYIFSVGDYEDNYVNQPLGQNYEVVEVLYLW
jgi:hypothetical protein